MESFLLPPLIHFSFLNFLLSTNLVCGIWWYLVIEKKKENKGKNKGAPRLRLFLFLGLEYGL